MSHLIHLRTFLEVYRSKSFSKAAKKLAITQPAASLHIQALEEFIGKKLFIRNPRGVEPTIVADELANSVAQNIDNLELKLSSFKVGQPLGGTIHLAAPADFIFYCLTDSLISLMEKGIHLRCQPGDKNKLYELLKNKMVDLAITASKPDDKQVEFSELLTENFLLVCSPAVQKKIGKKLDKNVLENLPFIAFDEDLPLIRSLWSQLFDCNINSQASCIIPDLRTIKKLVINGNGWSVLPDYHCREDIREGRLVALNSKVDVSKNKLYLVWNKGAQKNNVRFVKEYLLKFFSV